MDSDKVIFSIIGGITLVILAIIMVTSFRSNSFDENLTSVQEILGDNPNLYGAENSEVTIVKFSDFQCSACAQYSPVVKNLVNTNSGRVALVYRHFPLGIFPWSVNLARAAEAAGMQGKFWDYHDEIFVNQGEFSQPTFNESELFKYAEYLELDLEKFTNDYNSNTVLSKVQTDASIARNLGLNSTPSFYLVYGNNAEKVNMTQFDSLELRVLEILAAGSDISDSNQGDELYEEPSMVALLNLVNVQRDDISPANVEVVSSNQVEWPDSSLGCPQEDVVYTQVITPGYQVMLSHEDEVFDFRLNQSLDQILLCTQDLNL